VVRFRPWLAAAVALSAIISTLLRAQVNDDDKRKREEFLKAREETRTAAAASPSPDESPSPTAKPKSAKRKLKTQKSPSPTSKSTPEESPSPKAKSKASPHKPAGKKPASPSPKPKPSETPEPTAASPKPTESPSATPKKSKAAKKKSAAKKKTSKPKATAKQKKAPEPEKTPKPAKAASPKSSATPVEGPTAPAPRALAVPKPGAPPSPNVTPPSAEEAPAQLTIEKSGYEQARGFEPPPSPPPRRFGFWPWSRSSAPSYRYLTRSVIEEIRRAPVVSNRWKFIVVHNSGTRQGNARVFDYYHRRVRRMQNGLAYHFVIGNGTSTGNGQIEVGDRWRRQINGGHVHSDYLNNIALGICLVGDFNRDQPTRAQLESCDELIRYLRQRCGKADGRLIPVHPHREMNPPRWATDCPGDAFPYSWFRRF
jgi:hypothetical protein